MTTAEIVIIVALVSIAVMLITAYITLVVAFRYVRHIELKYLGEPEEYIGKEQESEQGEGKRTGNSGTAENEESVLRYSCKRDKGSWLLSLSSPKSHGADAKDQGVPKA